MKIKNNKKLAKPLKILFVTGLTLLTFIFVSPSIFLIFYIFFFRPFQVNGDSMSPNYKNGQYYLSKIQNDNFKRGDVIVFTSPEDPEKDIFKRIVALPNETVMLQDGYIYLNGQKLDESKYLPSEIRTYGGDYFTEGKSVTVPENSYFVLGDNRPFSSDSRVWGFVPQKSIIGEFLFCYWNCK